MKQKSFNDKHWKSITLNIIASFVILGIFFVANSIIVSLILNLYNEQTNLLGFISFCIITTGFIVTIMFYPFIIFVRGIIKIMKKGMED